MKYFFVLLVPFVMGCKSLQSTLQSGKEMPTETQYKLKNTNFPIEIIEAFVPFVHATVRADGKMNMSYELTVLNNYPIPLILKKVEIYDTNDPETPIQVLDANYLSVHFVRHGISQGNNAMELKGNDFGIVNIRLSIEESETTPTQIFHKLIFERVKEGQNTATYPIEVARLNMPPPTTIELGLPFKKGKWLYATSGHRDSRFITEGKSSYAQRYAIDWVLLDNDGFYAIGDKTLNKNWTTYGVEVLAVADGKVIDVKDGIIENIPLSTERAVPISRETIAGNYIVLDIGNGVSAVYAHLIPGSLKVKIGQQVKKGQVIALLGNSGNSDAPHLHFHLETKSVATLGGEGIPYYFSAFNQLIKFDDEEIDKVFDQDKIQLKDVIPSKRHNELPVGNGIIAF